MLQRSIVIFYTLLFFTGSLAFANSKVEELFIWKMSEELDLSPKEEKIFSDKFRELNAKKNGLNNQLQQLVQNDSSPSDLNKAKDFLKKYQSLLTMGNRVGVEEVEAMAKILGPERTVRYLRIKHDLSGKVRTLLSQPSSTRTAPAISTSQKGAEDSAKNKEGGSLPPPKVIVE